jgi:hypothetical protein
MEGGEDSEAKNPGLSIEGRVFYLGRLMKNIHLRRYPRPSSLRRTSMYASLLRTSDALHLHIFDQLAKDDLFDEGVWAG